MLLEDLEYIFKEQIEGGQTKLYFMLIDDEHKVVERHDAAKMRELLPMLDCFEYAGAEVMPRFIK
jgi:hypothetical protein